MSEQPPQSGGRLPDSIRDRIDALTPLEAVEWLWQTFMYAAAWGTSHYSEWDADGRAEFADMVKRGNLFGTVESLKRACLVHGIPLSDRILRELSLAHLTTDDPLPLRDRLRFQKHLNELYPLVHRLEADELRTKLPAKKTKADAKRQRGKPSSETQSDTSELNPTERAVLHIIRSQPKGQGIKARGIITALAKRKIELEETSLRRHILPKLKEHHGVISHRAAGGYLIADQSGAT